MTTAVAPISGDSARGSSAVEEGTAGGRGPAAVVSSGIVRPTSSGGDYVYPGALGSGGTLTTDLNAPTRTVAPTKASVEPNPGTERGPPPAESSSSLRSPPRPPPRPPPTVPRPDNTTPTSTAGPAAQSSGPRGGPPDPPPRPTTTQITVDVTESVDLGYNRTTLATLTRGPGAVSYCQASDLTVAPTSWSIVYTSTITWYGNPEDYTPAYPPISIPTPTSSCVMPPSPPPRMTISVCTSTGTGTKYVTCEVTTTSESWGFGVQTTAVPNPVVFITTDKNPAVVYSNIRTPDYGVSQPDTTRDDDHAKPTQAGVDPPPAYNSQNPPPQGMSSPGHQPVQTPVDPVTIGVQPTAVVINDNTIRDNPTAKTQVVVISSHTFTIDPTQIIGAGTTIDRASATGGGVFAPTPTSTSLAGLPVVISSSVAVIGGSTFSLSPATTTTIATISGQTFTIGPSHIAAASHTLPLPVLPAPTEVVVAGGEVITAVGGSVLIVRGTTLTLTTHDGGSGSGTPPPPLLITIDDDVLTLGADGAVTAHGGALTLGGAGARPGETELAVVGGATITKIAPSLVVIDRVTYTLGAGGAGETGTTTTLVVGGETITVAPDRVLVGDHMTLTYPFGPTLIITPTPTPGAGAGSAAVSATGRGGGFGGGSGDGAGDGDGEEDAAGLVRPPPTAWLGAVAAIAVGVGALNF